MGFNAPPQDKALSTAMGGQRMPSSIEPMRVNLARKGNFTVSAAAEARHIERAERQAVAQLARMSAHLCIAMDGGYIVGAGRVRRRCSDMHAVQMFISELQTGKVAR